MNTNFYKVRVYYNLPDSHYSYTTTLPTNQDVFIHRQPRASKTFSSGTLANGDGGQSKRQRVGGESDSVAPQDMELDEEEEDDIGEIYMGSVSLLSVVHAICRAR